MPCGNYLDPQTPDYAIWDSAHNPFDSAWIDSMKEVVCGCAQKYVWKARALWDCTGSPGGWVMQFPESVPVPEGFVDGQTVQIDTCNYDIYGPGYCLDLMPTLPDMDPDGAKMAALPADLDEVCCRVCQWTMRWVYNATTCNWDMSAPPSSTIVAKADTNVDRDWFDGDTDMLYYNRVWFVPLNGSGECDDTAPSGFDTNPQPTVYYLACLKYFAGPDCDSAVIEQTTYVIAIDPGAGCPDEIDLTFARFDWPLTGDCNYPSGGPVTLTLLNGPFASEAAASADASAAGCPLIEPA